MSRQVWRLALVIVAGGAALGQAPRTSPSFEAASLRRVDSAQGALSPLRGGPGSSDPGRISARNITLKALLLRAFNLKPDQVYGPAWIDTERYDLEAAVPADATAVQYGLMLQSLLVERFHLSLHHETRTFSGYQLVAVKNGAKVKESSAPAPAGRGASFNIGSGRAIVSAKGESLADFADVLGGMLIGRSLAPAPTQTHVVDRTGLKGFYDFTLEYAVPAAADELPEGADLFTALQRQLGLRLEEARLRLDVIVVDQGDKTPADD